MLLSKASSGRIDLRTVSPKPPVEGAVSIGTLPYGLYLGACALLLFCCVCVPWPVCWSVVWSAPPLLLRRRDCASASMNKVLRTTASKQIFTRWFLIYFLFI